MKKNILRSCLVSPLIIGAFLSSGHVFADENVPTQATTVTENVQSTVNESESAQQNTDTNNDIQLSENQSVDQEQSDFNNQEAVSSETQETTEDNNLISPVISQETSDKSIKDENITTSESEQQETNSDDENDSPDETKNLILTDSKVSTSNIQTLSQKVIDQLADSKVVKKETTSAALTAKGFDLQYNEAITPGAKIMFAVWSEVNGQDDLIWYTADSNGHAIAKYTGTYGLYNIHTYQNLNGQMKGLNGRTIDVPKPSAKVSIVKASDTTYKVTVSDIPAYITSIQLPTWTEKGGQDDIQWYGTTYNSDGTFTKTFSVAEHNFESGKYNVHYYGISSVTDTLTGLGGTSFNCDYQFGDIAITAKAGATGIEITMPQDIAKVANVSHAVWSEVKGQDDLKWYSDTTGYVVAPYTGDYGTYFVDTYANVKGRMICIGSTTIDIPKPSAKVSIVKESGTTYKVIVSDVPAYITSVQLPTWTAKNDQDDTIWYTAERQSDGTFTKTFSVAEHNFESGKYNVHYYGISSVTNTLTGLGGTIFNCDYKFGDVAISAKMGVTGIEINMPKDVASVANISHAVWSDANGQDDLKWYGDTTGHVVAPYTGDYGIYYVDTYANVKGQMICIGSTKVDIPKPSAKVTITKVDETTYKVTVSDVPVYMTDIQLPIWTVKNDQDDIIWYRATKNADGTYSKTFSIAEHNFESGKYNVHYYGTSNVTGQLTGLGGTIFNCDYKFGDVAISAKMGATGIEINMPKDVVSVANISHAVWSDANGQDDLKWYGDTTGHVVAPYTGDYGIYYVDTYANVKGQMICIGSTKVNVPKPEVKTTITKESDISVKVTVSNVPVYITGITIPVWTEANGQDDIQWYQATKQSDGTYVLNFSPKQHNFESGHYNIHIYGQSQISHLLEGLSSTGGVDLATEKYVVEPTVTVQNHDANGGTLKVRIAESENSKTIKLVRVAAWSEDNQSNIHWYTASDIYDGVVTVMVNEKNHDYIKGDYTVHVYVDFTDNTTSGFNLGTYRLNADKPVHAQSYFIDISSHNGVISVSEYQSLKRQGITGVVVKLTEGTSYTNPYARAQIANAQAAGLRVSAYHYSHYETAAEAKAEAQYFVNAAKSMGLSGATTMVNDMEEQAMLRSDLNANTQAWKDEMNRLGYNNNVYYTMASWLDVKGGKFNTSKFGMSNLWVAHYLYSTQYLDQESAKSLSYYSNSAAWQYTSASPKLSHPLDESIDYTGRFTW